MENRAGQQWVGRWQCGDTLSTLWGTPVPALPIQPLGALPQSWLAELGFISHGNYASEHPAPTRGRAVLGLEILIH